MADPLDVVTKLMALALNNPNEEEARSAALKAVQMIQSHGFKVQRPVSSQATAFQDLYARSQAAVAYQQQQRSNDFIEWMKNYQGAAKR